MTSPSGQQPKRKWHVCVRPKTAALDGHARDVLADTRQIDLENIQGVQSSRLYLISGTLDESHVRVMAEDLLTDPVVETFDLGEGLANRTESGAAIEVHTLPGVMDPIALSTLDAARRLLEEKGLTGATIDELHTARRYEIVGAKGADELERIASGVLANDCIETWYLTGPDRNDPIPDAFPKPPVHQFELRRVALRQLEDEQLARLSREGHLFLSVPEMKTIRDHFRDKDRDPTDLELETLAQTWSEHCVHKTLKSEIVYRGDDFGRPGTTEAHFGNLLKDTIAHVTQTLNRDWCLSVFVDNAGIISFDDDFGVAFKVETHNHPSAIEPYGGAATGIGGCIRDIMGCGLGAKPIASTDVFCLAPPDFDPKRLPKDVLHPRRVLKGVVSGVRDYGNRMGIPTVNGALFFDDRYLANPLVFCGCIGMIPRDRIDKEPRPGDAIIVAGGRTGRDGIHGATFSSAELTDTHADEFSHAVQIGHAIAEKKLLDALLLARDHHSGCLYSAVTDCGAGGLSSAVGEMGAEIGAVVDLENAPLKYSGLRYDEIWVSEAQERMVFAVPQENVETMLALFQAEEVEANVIGTFADDGVLRVRYQGKTVGQLDMKFLHDGLPKQTRQATWSAKPDSRKGASDGWPRSFGPGGLDAAEQTGDQRPSDLGDANGRLLAALRKPNTASKEWVIRQYDHEVQGRSVVKPLAGPKFGPSDAAVLRPRYDSPKGIAVACGLCPELSDIDPYWMAVAAVDEALRNVICVGANPDHTAILDNFCWPKVDTEESLGALVRTCRGATDAAIAFGLPFISGKDSLNNEFSMSTEEARRTGMPEQIAIPYTLLISAMGLVDDVQRCVTMDLKQPGNCLALASAPTVPAASQLLRQRKDPAQEMQRASLDDARALHHRVAELIRSGKVTAAHDISDGGLAVTISEMSIASNLGAAVTIDAKTYTHSIFEPIATSYVLEMTQDDARDANLPIIGTVKPEPQLRIDGVDSSSIDLPVSDLAAAWRSPLAKGGGRSS